MKNNILKLSIILAISLAMASCNDSFLERSPIVNISDGNFWKSGSDLKLYVNNFYNNSSLMPSYTGYGTVGPCGLDADYGSDTQITPDYDTYLNGEYKVPSSGGGWSVSDWSLLRRINYFMDNYHRVNADWNEVKQYVGEVYVFRSMFYFSKLRSFGDLPWVSKTLSDDSEILFQPRRPRNEVVDSIMADLDKAVEYLPARGNYTGRLTKEVAMLFQARIALFEGTWEKYHSIKNTPFKVPGQDGSKFIKKAADVTDALMNLAETSGRTALVDGKGMGYHELFNQYDYSNNKEVLLWRSYSDTDNLTHHWSGYYYGYGRGMTRRLIDAYLCMDGKPIAASNLYQGDKSLKDIVANRDPRLNQTMFVDDGEHIFFDSNNSYFTVPAFDGVVSNSCPTGYQQYKGFNHSYTEAMGSRSFIGAIYFRYAEALLINAEAKAELGTITQVYIDKTINALRKRVGMTGLLDMNNITTDPNWEFKAISPLLNEIRRERKVELALEGFRLDDIFRWAAADEILVGYKPKGAYKDQWKDYPGAASSFVEAWQRLKVDEEGYIDPFGNYPAMEKGYMFNVNRDYLLPISTEELVLNPELKQNPGWE
ncbi:MAG: RagB/SusD family nutrient uptake outer membrane protein [Muribaculaceae bacterium]